MTHELAMDDTVSNVQDQVPDDALEPAEPVDPLAICQAKLADLTAAVGRQTTLIEGVVHAVNSLGEMSVDNSAKLTQFMEFATAMQSQIQNMDLGSILRGAIMGKKARPNGR